jgi:hypothetical protein
MVVAGKAMAVKRVLEALKVGGILRSWEVTRLPADGEWGTPAYTKVHGRGCGVLVSEETYGKKSVLYLTCMSEKRDAVKRILRELGVKFGENMLGRLDVSISPIKGWHWWE